MDSHGQPQQHHGHPKRRQYATGQTQAYYGATDPVAPYPEPSSYPAPQTGGHLFTPGLATPDPASYPAQPQPAPYYGGSDPAYPNGQYSQPVQSGVNQVVNQFNQMNLGQKPVRSSVYLSFSFH